MMRYLVLAISLVFVICNNSYSLGDINNPLGFDITKKLKKKSSQKSNSVPLPSSIIEKKDNTKATQITDEADIEDDEDDEEFTPFIDKGMAKLPIAPIVAESLSEGEIPDSIFEDSKEKLDKNLARASIEEEEKELEDEIKQLFANTDSLLKSQKDQNNLPSEENSVEKIDIASDISEEEIDKIAPQKKEILQEQNKNLAQNNDSQNKPKELAKQEAPKIPSLPKASTFSKLPEEAPGKKEYIAIPEKKPSIKPQKTKIDPKLMRFVRDESVFILFKDDDIILGKLSQNAELEQISFLSYYQKYRKKFEFSNEDTRSKEIEQFIKTRSYVAHVPISNKNLIHNIKQEISKSNLSNLRILEDYYDTLDITDKDGNSMAHLASMQDNPATIKWLIMKGANLNKLNNNALSAREIAFINNNRDAYLLLKQAGAR